MASALTVQEINRRLAVQVNEEARRDPKSPYAGKWVGIANGQVVVIAEGLGEMCRVLRQVEPDASRTFGVEASRDYSEVFEIWSAA